MNQKFCVFSIIFYTISYTLNIEAFPQVAEESEEDDEETETIDEYVDAIYSAGSDAQLEKWKKTHQDFHTAGKKLAAGLGVKNFSSTSIAHRVTSVLVPYIQAGIYSSTPKTKTVNSTAPDLYTSGVFEVALPNLTKKAGGGTFEINIPLESLYLKESQKNYSDSSNASILMSNDQYIKTIEAAILEALTKSENKPKNISQSKNSSSEAIELDIVDIFPTEPAESELTYTEVPTTKKPRRRTRVRTTTSKKPSTDGGLPQKAIGPLQKLLKNVVSLPSYVITAIEKTECALLDYCDGIDLDIF